MSDPSKRKDPNATIQIDLDQVQLFDPGAIPEPDASEPGARSLPPPLPASASLPGVAQAAPPNPAKTIALVAMFVVLIGLAIVGGLMVGSRVGGKAQVTPAPSATTGAVATPSAVPSSSAAPATLTLPTIEMH